MHWNIVCITKLVIEGHRHIDFQTQKHRRKVSIEKNIQEEYSEIDNRGGNQTSGTRK
jgi:hypothetical protein